MPFYSNYHKMLTENPDIAVVNIITPSGMHFEHAMDVIKTHRRNVLIEKPVVMTMEQGVALRDEAQKLDVEVFPIFQNRFNKAVEAIKSNAGEGKESRINPCGHLAKLRWCRPQRYYDLSDWRGTWAMDGGAYLIREFTMLIYYVAAQWPCQRVCATVATLGAKIEVEDTAVAILEFENGALTVIEVMTSARPDDFEASISYVGADGLAVVVV